MYILADKAKKKKTKNKNDFDIVFTPNLFDEMLKWVTLKICSSNYLLMPCTVEHIVILIGNWRPN